MIVRPPSACVCAHACTCVCARARAHAQRVCSSFAVTTPALFLGAHALTQLTAVSLRRLVQRSPHAVAGAVAGAVVVVAPMEKNSRGGTQWGVQTIVPPLRVCHFTARAPRGVVARCRRDRARAHLCGCVPAHGRLAVHSMSLAACDYYELLGVERGAPVAAIRRAYLSRARQAHPDKAACSPQAAEDARFVAVQRAWEVLRDECTRAAYDGLLAMGDGRGVLAADAEHAVMAARFTITDELDLCDMTLEQVQGEEEAPCDA
ncbi:J domain-containing protein, partial [archaeon]